MSDAWTVLGRVCCDLDFWNEIKTKIKDPSKQDPLQDLFDFCWSDDVSGKQYGRPFRLTRWGVNALNSIFWKCNVEDIYGDKPIDRIHSGLVSSLPGMSREFYTALGLASVDGLIRSKIADKQMTLSQLKNDLQKEVPRVDLDIGEVEILKSLVVDKYLLSLMLFELAGWVTGKCSISGSKQLGTYAFRHYDDALVSALALDEDVWGALRGVFTQKSDANDVAKILSTRVTERAQKDVSFWDLIADYNDQKMNFYFTNLVNDPGFENAVAEIPPLKKRLEKIKTEAKE